jgi:hypothetical protein
MIRHPLFASTALYPLMMAAEGQEEAPTTGATATNVGDTTRVVVGNTGEADAAATAGATSTGAEAPKEGEAAPTGLPEGFDSVEAFVKAVNDGTYKPAGQEAPKTEEQQTLPDDPRFEPFTKEFTETGDLKPESVAEAAKAFLGEDNPTNRTMIETYVRGLKAAASQSQAEITVQSQPFVEAAGGQEQWTQFRAWTAEDGNVDAATERAYNALVDQGKPEEALAVLQPVLSKWKADGGGNAPRDVTKGPGGGPGGSGGDSYANWEQARKDMDKPEYANDPAFRKSVEEKLGRSPF